MGIAFADWLEGEMGRRRISQAELARRGGISQAAVSLVLKRKRQAGRDLCYAVAAAFEMDEEEVMRLAGLLPKRRKPEPIEEHITREVQKLNRRRQEMVRDYVALQRQAQAGESTGNSDRPAKVRSLPPE